MNFSGRLKAFFGLAKPVADDFFDDLEDLLVEGDFGAAGAVKIVDELRDLARKEKSAGTAEIRRQFAALLEKTLLPAPAVPGLSVPNTAAGLSAPETPLVILLLGVNGVGKTTTAAKLGSLYRSKGRRPVLAAADTFRAAAIDQLKIHGERLGLRVVAHQHGGDPAAVVYDAVEAALSGGGDLVIADTAGRMHTKSALVEELKKIDRVLETKLGREGISLKWLVLDATTGRNALAQAEIFHQAVRLDGVILTKYDSLARGGVVFSLASELSLPVVFLCDGEGYNHIRLFDPAAFVEDFLGD